MSPAPAGLLGSAVGCRGWTTRRRLASYQALKAQVQESRDTRLEQIGRKRTQLPVDSEAPAKSTGSDEK